LAKIELPTEDGSSLSPNLLYGSGNGKLVEAGKEINTANLREATRGQVFKAPQGTVKIDPDNYHTYLYSRIAKWKSDGQADIVFSTPAAVKPIPWSQALIGKALRS
jgi:hypothetical protein